MRVVLLLLLAGFLLAQAPSPAPKAVGTMSELMIDVIYPTSNAVFYLFREPPKNEVITPKQPPASPPSNPVAKNAVPLAARP